MMVFIDGLHANNQHYVTIVDSALYIPNPDNVSDAYSVYTQGHDMDVFMKNPDGSEYIGAVWPGFTVFPDWTAFWAWMQSHLGGEAKVVATEVHGFVEAVGHRTLTGPPAQSLVSTKSPGRCRSHGPIPV